MRTENCYMPGTMLSSLKALFHLILTTNPVSLCPFCGCGHWSFESFVCPTAGPWQSRVWCWELQSKYNRCKNVTRVKTGAFPGSWHESWISQGQDSVGCRNRLERKGADIRRKDWQAESKTGNKGQRERTLSEHPACPANARGYFSQLHNHFMKEILFRPFCGWRDGFQDLKGRPLSGRTGIQTGPCGIPVRQLSALLWEEGRPHKQGPGEALGATKRGGKGTVGTRGCHDQRLSVEDVQRKFQPKRTAACLPLVHSNLPRPLLWYFQSCQIC